MATNNNAMNTQGVTPGAPKYRNGFLDSLQPPKAPISTNQSTNPNATALGQATPSMGNNTGQPLAISNADHPTAPTGSIKSHKVITDPATGKSTTTQTFDTSNNDTSTKKTSIQSETPELTPEQRQANTNLDNQRNYGLLPTGQKVGSTTENAQNLLNTGPQTDLEKQRMGILDQAGTQTPDERAATNAVAYGLGVRNNNTFGQYAEAGLHGNDPQAYVDEANAPDLVGRASATRGLAGAYSNLYGTQAQAYLNSAQTAAGRGLSASQSGLSAAQNQASRAQGVAGSVFNSSLLTPTTQGQAPFSGLNGYQDGSNQFGNPTDPASGVNVQSYKDMYDTYNKGNLSLNQAKALEPNILNTLASHPELNNQPLSAITKLSEFLSGQASVPGQQQLSTDVANYIKNLGIDTATLQSTIAQQQSGTLVQLLNNLKDIATKNNEAIKTTADNLKKNNSSSSSSPSSGSSSGDFSWDFLKGL